ncbi:hypothetical protein FLO80_03925 [Aquicoccus porphyridii]|uniref:Uncharacterized protein n=1 Tax=Aquicoccus porphyridii TaxID=1852029 RepID=A0A5A9ZSI3_9RHOB|nr:hypothetical protein [Aquicoccus porphyridii]KAA0920273.1 hypothetical protein FLO80_03925 [Aquicoccus porphyridii]RAI54931.1 hypothetical protein DOO74_06855 [Rhodobacteraceae bacterium AsT-22]
MSGTEHRAQSGRGQVSVFLERSTYRRRRLVDAMRLLPLLGVGLWAVPLLWNARARETPMSHAVLYVFGVWLLLVVAAGIMAVMIGRRNSDTGEPGEADGPAMRF